MNKVTLEGKLGRDPEMRYLPNGMMFCGVSMATSNDYKDRQSGEWIKKPPSWHNLTAFGKDAEAMSAYHKGDTLKVEGKIQYEEYTAKDGTKKSITKILCFGIPTSAPKQQEAPQQHDGEEPPF